MHNGKPTADEIQQAAGRTIPDIIAPGLRVLFCGINPGLYSAAVQHHFARPGNRFWPTLQAAGITPRLLAPTEEQELLALGYGITNIVDRATAGAAELTREELIAGAKMLEEKVLQYAPRFLAVLGISAYRTAFNRPKATLGRQEECIGETRLWVLPNPSGLNAHFQIADLAKCFKALKEER
ncbi:MAG TPA: G/U mismatch-specific DNA glycosylase [Armatimonadota bacterium]